MGKFKEKPKYNVLSIRLTDDEKALLDEIMRNSQKTVSMIMREAIHEYAAYINGSVNAD